jgi:glyoxylase-like metal-dependent hydrolase (beta-lactamase superfamily II)
VLSEVAEDIFVRQSEFCLTNSVVVRVDDGLILIDPGVTGRDLSGLADDLDALGGAVVAGFATHPHWDHVLWHERFGRHVPRFATARCAQVCHERRERLRTMTGAQSPDTPLDLVGEVKAITDETPWNQWGLRVIAHDAHAPGHAALMIDRARTLIAGDMLSDVEIPLLDPGADDPWGDYRSGFAQLEAEVGPHVVALIPGHGQIAFGDSIPKRVAADRTYLDALGQGRDPEDPRIGPDATYGTDWLPEAHERNISLAPAPK